MKKVYVVCAAGVATSTMVRLKVEAFLREKGIAALVTQHRVSELSVDRLDADAIVATTGMPSEFGAVVPVLNGVSLLTGIGQQAVLDELALVLSRP